MPRFKSRETNYLFFQIDLNNQFNYKSIEYMLSDFVDKHIDMNKFENKYNNDIKGQPAIHPSILLKVILYSFMNGVNSTREMEKLTQESLAYKYLSCDTEIDHTTIAKFMSKYRLEIENFNIQKEFINFILRKNISEKIA